LPNYVTLTIIRAVEQSMAGAAPLALHLNQVHVLLELRLCLLVLQTQGIPLTSHSFQKSLPLDQ